MSMAPIETSAATKKATRKPLIIAATVTHGCGNGLKSVRLSIAHLISPYNNIFKLVLSNSTYTQTMVVVATWIT